MVFAPKRTIRNLDENSPPAERRAFKETDMTEIAVRELSATDFRVADLSLAEFGRREITIAEHEMPGLTAPSSRSAEPASPAPST